MPHADTNSDNICTESQPEPSQDVHVQPVLNIEQEDASVSTGSAPGDLQDILSSVLDDHMPAAAMQSPASSSPTDLSPTGNAQANSSRDAPATIEQMLSRTDSDMMPLQLDISELKATQEDILQQQQPHVSMSEDQQVSGSTESDMLPEQLSSSVLEGTQDDSLQQQQQQPLQQPHVCMPVDQQVPSSTDRDMMPVQLNDAVLEVTQKDMLQHQQPQQQAHGCMPDNQQTPSSTDNDMMPKQLKNSVLGGTQEDSLQQRLQQPDVCMPDEQESTVAMADGNAPQTAQSTDRPVRVVFSIAKQNAEQTEEMLKVHLHLNNSGLEGTQEASLQERLQQQPDVRMPDEQGSTMTMATVNAPQTAQSADRPMRVFFSIAKQNAEQTKEMLKVHLHVGKFYYNRERLLEIRALVSPDRMPTGWRPVQPEDEFVLKIYEAMLDERSRQGGARRPFLPPRDAGPAPQGHDIGWRGAQRQAQLPQPRYSWPAMYDTPGGPLPPPRPPRGPPVHDEDSWLTTLNKLPAPSGIPTPAEDGPMSGHRGPALGQSSRPLQQLGRRDSGEPRHALGQTSRPQPQPRPPSEDTINGEFIMPKRPQPSLFVDEDDRWPVAHREQDFPPLQPTDRPAGQPHPKLHLLQGTGEEIPSDWSIPAVNGPPVRDVSEDVLDTLRQAGMQLGDACMSLLGGLPYDIQKACVLPLMQAANRTGTHDNSMFMGVILGVAAVQGERAEKIGPKAANRASTVAARALHAPPGFEHIQAAAPESAADTPTSADGIETFIESNGSKVKPPPPGFDKHQHVTASSAVLSLQSANGIREDHTTARGRSTARPLSRASSRASSGELDPAILAMLLPKAPKQDESDLFGGVLSRGPNKTAGNAQSDRDFWDRPSGISDRDLLEGLRGTNRHEGIRRRRSSQIDLRRRYSGGLQESDRLETGSAASDSFSESNLYSRLMGFIKEDPKSGRSRYPPHMRKPDKMPENMDSRTGRDLQGLLSGGTEAQPVPGTANREQEPQSLFERLEKALPGPPKPLAQQTRTSVFDRLRFPQTSQTGAPAQQNRMPAPQRTMRPPVLQDNDFALSGASKLIADETRASVFDRLTVPQTSQPETQAPQKKQTPASQRMMRPPVLQDSDFVPRNFDTPLSKISEASENTGCLSTGGKKSSGEVDQWVLVEQSLSSSSPGASGGIRSGATASSAAVHSEADSNDTGAEQESAVMNATARAIVDLVHPEGHKYSPLAAQQWTDLNHTIKSALTATTDERITSAARGRCVEEAEDLTKSLTVLLEPVHAAHHPGTAACWRVLTSQEKLQVKDGVLDGWRMHLGMLEPRRRALAQRMTVEHPSAAAARARIAGMCPQLRDMLLLLLNDTDSLDILDAVVAALTGMQKYEDKGEVDSMQSSNTVSAAPARQAQVQKNLPGYSQPPSMHPMSQAAACSASAEPTKGPGSVNSSQLPDLLQILLSQKQPPPKAAPQVPPPNSAIPRRPQPKNTYAAALLAPPVISSRVIDDGKRKREAAPTAPAASATKPGKKKPWWETDQGVEELASVQEVYGGHRNADNTFAVKREVDEFEELGLLEPSVFQGDTKKKKRTKAPGAAQMHAAPRQIKRLAGNQAYAPKPAQRAPQPQAWRPPPMTTAVPPMPIGPPPSLAPPPPGFASMLARFRGA